MSDVKDVKKDKEGIFARLKRIKHIEIIIAVAFIGILLLIYFVSFSSKSESGTSSEPSITYSSSTTYAKETEAKLKSLLSSVKGVGSADVMISFESTVEMVIAYIETTSSNKGSDGTESTSTSKTPSLISQNGSQSPIVLKELTPKVVGILVVAEGGSNPIVKQYIISAVSTLLDVDAGRIAVLEKVK